jgi:hypothetical protein
VKNDEKRKQNNKESREKTTQKFFFRISGGEKMSITYFTNFKTNTELEDFVRFLRRHCGINFRKRNGAYEANVCGVFAYLHKEGTNIQLSHSSYAGLHFYHSQWVIVHDFLSFSVTEMICAKFKCSAEINSFEDLEEFYEVTYNPPPKKTKSQQQKPFSRDDLVCKFEKKTRTITWDSQAS